jgi:hypothetical protein
MERLWSLAGATGGNRWQIGEPRKRLKQADWQRVATHGNRFGAHGKEGVDGSSPSEGLNTLQITDLCCLFGHYAGNGHGRGQQVPHLQGFWMVAVRLRLAQGNREGTPPRRSREISRRVRRLVGTTLFRRGPSVASAHRIVVQRGLRPACSGSIGSVIDRAACGGSGREAPAEAAPCSNCQTLPGDIATNGGRASFVR